MPTVRRPGRFPSERIVRLCEQPGIACEPRRRERDPETILARPEPEALHPAQAAPPIADGDVRLAGPAAIAECVMARRGGRLAVGADDPGLGDGLCRLVSPTARRSRAWAAA